VAVTLAVRLAVGVGVNEIVGVLLVLSPFETAGVGDGERVVDSLTLGLGVSLGVAVGEGVPVPETVCVAVPVGVTRAVLLSVGVALVLAPLVTLAVGEGDTVED